MSKVRTGTLIKSYDFRGMNDCYVIGMVTEINGDLLKCIVIKAVSQGKTYEFPGGEFVTQKQGAGLFDSSWPNRVEIIG